MNSFYALRDLPPTDSYKKGDIVFIFGEVFQSGYVNGLISAAVRRGLKVYSTTVGRREGDALRNLTNEELTECASRAPLDGVLNATLEAGFDFEPSSQGKTPVDQISGLKMSQWQEAKIDWNQIEESKERGRERFFTSARQWAEQVSEIAQQNPDSNILFVHTMAGGIPRAKILMPTMNRIFKGRGDRYLASKTFWESELGKLCSVSFDEVTAQTYQTLIDVTQPLREERKGKRVAYVAYGYHGCELLMNGQYTWQSYAPYLQGWAKLELEKISQRAFSVGVTSCVFNCPEILTNSSSLFQGVEIPLYPLIEAVRKDAPNHFAKVEASLKPFLKPGVSLDSIYESCMSFFNNPSTQFLQDFNSWPQHSEANQMDLMLEQSDRVFDMQTAKDDSITNWLSRLVFEGCGHLMFEESAKPCAAVEWLGHDIIAKRLSKEADLSDF
ncbi:MAG: hypothetical protein COT74_01845 [Bdellovibrionales bacterium CG10_big_fil_rev_8_21_14_0_10_45_34]|nr:MAG: hypothetical protein COT74_01845 [Bdellovibrionales bacterium CG10_big_fil_rev_8_21_14_0_10_45_34]